ncbi:glycosyl hydrolase family 61-domain-containing protein [Massariosphaeria phaeospora]|uniref:lytic cellulose monooxygenase (C4-dehydrogenating) n=1 Tax=Massariosphaeria phaeospora TaxID=100035 RepID=A0A7C8IEQ4_9PLEO|nr:glycosyl hydrolase family 61-domain-containing protein [Massariosphaeria phaeospora]
MSGVAAPGLTHESVDASVPLNMRRAWGEWGLASSGKTGSSTSSSVLYQSILYPHSFVTSLCEAGRRSFTLSLNTSVSSNNLDLLHIRRTIAMSFTTTLFTLGAMAATAMAHGTVSGLTIDGQFHGGFKLDYYYKKQQGQPIPETAGWYAENLDNGFVEPNAFKTADVICHKNAEPATGSVSVAAGGSMAFHWDTWPESHVGPIILYAAPVADFASIKKEELKFVKIEEAGFKAGSWAASDLVKSNNTWASTVPATLAAGKYVFRHEIIALHSAGTVNGAQSYPQCFNVEVTGSGTASPEGTLGTALYTPDEEGIVWNAYGDNSAYPIPGPKLMAGGSSTPTTPSTPVGGNSTTPITTPSATPSTVKPVATPSPSAGSGDAEVPSTETPADGDLPETFTLDTFIAWLKEKASSKVRRHARQF